MTLWTRAFWLATLERCIGTAAAAFLAAIGTAAVLHDVPWPAVASTVALATLVTAVKCVLVATGGDGPGVGSQETLAARKPTHRADTA